ncbi:hypothetical protein ATCC90586_001761 [Pythium insidiosum]|nr:hypothetical protein ATCC90586_001761 [Pythium insidiosum]
MVDDDLTLQCAAACDDWLYVGDSEGSLRAFHVGRAQDGAIDLSAAEWSTQVSDAGDAVLETRRLQLPHAVTSLLAIGDLHFVATDIFGHTYGLTLYDMSWKLAASDSDGFFGSACSFLHHGTLSTYVFVALWDRPLILVTQRDQVVASIATPTPIRSMLAVPTKTESGVQGEDVVLIAGDNGSVSRIRTVRSPKESPPMEEKFEIVVEPFIVVDVAIAKILRLHVSDSLLSDTACQHLSYSSTEMLTKAALNELKDHVEEAIDKLLRAADSRVSWRQPSALEPQDGSSQEQYSYLPGVYCHPATAADASPSDGPEANEQGCIRVVLHGDNTFEYRWSFSRRAPRAMEYTVEMTGEWSKPVLNRSRRGDDDQRTFLTARRIRFQRLSNYDAESDSWKLCLRTLTRHGSDWAPVGESERGVPPIVMVFTCQESGVLESTGAVLPSQLLSNSPACRVLAGLTKKVANKLGGPIDVMTEKWLPPRNLRLHVSDKPEDKEHVRPFNPFYCAMATPTNAGAVSPAAGSATTPAGASKTTPHLHSVASSLRSCLDGMLPDELRNDAAAFQQHLHAQKTRIQSEKNSWRFGLNYIFETLKQHKDWYSRNQQFVQLRKDVKRLENHVSALRSTMSEAVSKLDLEAGLRVAELEGRVGAYKIMFEVTKIVTKLSRPLVKLQILKTSESSLSIYCDTFVLDIALSGGEVRSRVDFVDLTKQFPERDDDLLRALKQLAAGESSIFTEKLVRLINRAELAVKYPNVNFEQLEEDMFQKLTQAAATQSHWKVTRTVDGIGIHFRDPLHCLPVVEPPRKKLRLDDTKQAQLGSDIPGPIQAAAVDVGADAGDKTQKATASGEDASVPPDVEASTPLAHGEWTGNVSFIEWRDEIALHVVGYTPLVMVGVQARRLALAAMRKPTATMDPTTPDDEKAFNDFVSWVAPVPAGEEPRKPIAPQLHFARDHSVCTVAPPASTTSFSMRQEYSLITKEISGGLQLHAFPIPLTLATAETLNSVLQICGHSLLFHSILLSAFSSRNSVFGRRVTSDMDDALYVPIKVDVSAPERITLKIDSLKGLDKALLIEFGIKSDCSLNVSVKTLDTLAAAGVVPSSVDSAILSRLGSTCHALPLLTFFAIQHVLQRHQSSASSAATSAAQSTGVDVPSAVPAVSPIGAGDAVGAAPSNRTAGGNGEDCNGIVSLDDAIAVPMKLEGEDMLLEEMDMF